MDRVKIIKHYNNSYGEIMRTSTRINWSEKDKYSGIIDDIHNIYSEIVNTYFENFFELPPVDYVKKEFKRSNENYTYRNK